MSELIAKLGLNWKLLLAQAVNFLLILTILRLTVYKPLVNMLHERRERIAKGLQDAEDAGKRLSEADRVKQEKLAEAEREAMQAFGRMEQEAKQKEVALLREAHAKETEILKTAERVAAAKAVEAEEKVFAEANGLVKAAIVKTVNLKPEAVDESLVSEALRELKKAV